MTVKNLGSYRAIWAMVAGRKTIVGYLVKPTNQPPAVVPDLAGVIVVLSGGNP